MTLERIEGDEFRVDVGKGGTWQTLSAHGNLADALAAYDLYVSQLSDKMQGGWQHLRVVRNGVHVMLTWDAGRR